MHKYKEDTSDSSTNVQSMRWRVLRVVEMQQWRGMVFM